MYIIIYIYYNVHSIVYINNILIIIYYIYINITNNLLFHINILQMKYYS